MKIVVQRVSHASVSVDGHEISSIGKGYFVLLGIKEGDSQHEADLLAEKLIKLRVMSDSEDKMNLTVGDISGEILVVSQFTLYADTVGGNRPSFTKAARPEVAEPLYKYFVEKLKNSGAKVQTGQFGANMQITTNLDGPVSIIIES